MRSVRKRKQGSAHLFPVLALSVSLGGFALFYLLPFVVSAVYAFTENPVRLRFAGLRNFEDLARNPFFLLGLKNTVLLMAYAIPLSLGAALLLALALKRLGRAGSLLCAVFLIPLVLPSAATVQFWLKIFAKTGVLNGFLHRFGIAGLPWLADGYIRGVMVFLYLWKYLGYNAVLFLAGLYAIPEVYYDCARVFGAGPWQKFRRVTLVYLTPTFFLVFLMSFVNSFKIFREIYLMMGSYPPESVYLLQHFVNNTLLSLHYHKLVSAVYVLTLLIVAVVVPVFRAEGRIAEHLRE
ncbi:MAG: sugar ABC transporter permease [Clostridium sp.]|nr:sugar ABC transporter permease [Clostridium sp.]